jgi:UDP-glucose 4-epimerase
MTISSKILVTGAAGFIGSHTVDQLLAAEHEVWGVDNFRTGRRENLALAFPNPRFHFAELDVAVEPDFVGFVGKIKPDAIIHLAALVSVPESIANPALNERLNFQATRIVAEAARLHKVTRIVFASSAAVYGDPQTYPIDEDTVKNPLSPYGSAKLSSENLLFDYARTHGITARCQRYFNVYGPRQDPRSPYSGVISIFLDHLVRKASPTIFGDGEQTRDFVYVHDVARANTIAATSVGLTSGVVNICTGRAVSLNQLWRLLASDRPDCPAPIYAPLRPGDIQHSCGCTDLARYSLGFKARHNLAEGLRALRGSASTRWT